MALARMLTKQRRSAPVPRLASANSGSAVQPAGPVTPASPAVSRAAGMQAARPVAGTAVQGVTRGGPPKPVPWKPDPLTPIAVGVPESQIPAILTGAKPPAKPVPFTSPPAGTYDPSIDQQVDAAGRGLGYAEQDYGVNVGRTREDFKNAYSDTARGFDRSKEDIGFAADDAWTRYQRETGDLQRTGQRNISDLDRTLGRGEQDYSQARTYAGQDKDRALAQIARNYAILGNQQAQGARAAGVAQGGALQQALEKRRANESLDQQPVNQAYDRTVTGLDQNIGRLREDVGTGKTRSAEDYWRGMQGVQDWANQTGRDIGTASERLGEDRSIQLGGSQWSIDPATGKPMKNKYGEKIINAEGRIGQQAARGLADLGRGIGRARDETRELGLDANDMRWYQARSYGNLLPPPITRAQLTSGMAAKGGDPYGAPKGKKKGGKK